MSTKKDLDKGFTLLEVTLVLAIAGMIFLMVMIALPQMRRSQRDAERRDDMMLFVEAVKKFQSNNRGVLPGTLSNGSTEVTQELLKTPGRQDDEFSWVGFYQQYLDPGTDEEQGQFRDPNGDFYQLRVRECKDDDKNEICEGNDPEEGKLDYTIHINTGATCKEDYTIVSTNPRDFAVLYHTESSGVICYDSRN